MILLVPVLFAGCVDKKQMERIEENQSNILTKLENMEKEISGLKVAPAPRRPTVDFNKVYNLPIGTSAIKGKKEAPITITEFSDFQCPYCSRVQPTLKQVLDAFPDDVKLVYKDFPLSFHQQAKNASKAARAAGEQGKYWEMHDLLFRDFNKLTDDSYKQYATELKLNVEKFLADYNSSKYDKLIQDDINLGRASGVTGTPTLFVNGKRMQRRSFDDFKARIEEIKKEKKS
jgi:protein-disulfide isomerase